jgi:predicted cupin superfamily sugar epimerase
VKSILYEVMQLNKTTKNKALSQHFSIFGCVVDPGFDIPKYEAHYIATGCST